MKRKHYPLVKVAGHPLAWSDGRVLLSRLTLWEKMDGQDGECHWCDRPIGWFKGLPIVADHLDSNTLNNAPDNLVASCTPCNAHRSDGTGYGRRKPKACEHCSKPFYASQRRVKFCSPECGFASRRGTKSEHGTTTRYRNGCRCDDCRAANTQASRNYYNKRKAST